MSSGLIIEELVLGEGVFGREVRSHTVKGWIWMNVKLQGSQENKREAIILSQILLMKSKNGATSFTYTHTYTRVEMCSTEYSARHGRGWRRIRWQQCVFTADIRQRKDLETLLWPFTKYTQRFYVQSWAYTVSPYNHIQNDILTFHHSWINSANMNMLKQ